MLPGSTGLVGTVGQSYMGFAQLALASTRPPHLKAMSVVSGFCWLWDNCVYRKGILEVVRKEKFILCLNKRIFLSSILICLQETFSVKTEKLHKLKSFINILEKNYRKQSVRCFFSHVLTKVRLGFNKPGWEQMAEFATLTHPLDRNFEGQIPETLISQDFESKGISWISEIMKNPDNTDHWGSLSNVRSQPDLSVNKTNIDVPIFHVGSW
jgi:predicted acyl esterase